MLSRTLLSPLFPFFLARAIPTLCFWRSPLDCAFILLSLTTTTHSVSLSAFHLLHNLCPLRAVVCHRRHVDIATRHLALGATRSRSTIYTRAIHSIPRRPRSTVLCLPTIRQHAGAKSGATILARYLLLLGQSRQALDRGRQHKTDAHGHLPHLPAHRPILVHQGIARQDLWPTRRVSQPANKALRTQSRHRRRRRSLQVRHPLSHQRPLYRPDSKPQLPPRPSQDHPLLRASSSSSSSSSSSNTPAQAQFQTTPAGDIVLPSWTDAGPTPLRVIVEEPEYELSPINSPATSRPHSPAYPQHAAPSPDSPNHSWAFRSAPSRDNASLRLRERGDYAALPSPIDRSSTPDTRLEDVKRPFNRPFYAEPYTAQPSSNPPEFTVHTPSSSFSPA